MRRLHKDILEVERTSRLFLSRSFALWIGICAAATVLDISLPLSRTAVVLLSIFFLASDRLPGALLRAIAPQQGSG